MAGHARRSKTKSKSGNGKASKTTGLFAFDGTPADRDASTGRPKRKLKAVVRFDQQRFDAKQAGCKIGHGFTCPRCSHHCSYDSKVCEECQLECCYEAGIGVVTLKRRHLGPVREERASNAAEPQAGDNNDEGTEANGPVAEVAADSDSTRHSSRARSINQHTNHRNQRLAVLAKGSLEVCSDCSSQVVTGSCQGGDKDDLPEELRGIDRELIERITNEIVGSDSLDPVLFDDVVGLEDAKRAVNEMMMYPLQRPDLFSGLRAPKTKGMLLFGPPGNGKTMIAKAIAHESGATFFAISSSSLISKWLGEGERLVGALFAVAASRSPSVVFIDEVDFLLAEDSATRRMKSEFCARFDGARRRGDGGGATLIVGATNKPWMLDADVRRRFARRLYVPLPDQRGRESITRNLLRKSGGHELTEGQVARLARETHGYSGSDLKHLCEDAAMGPLRDGGFGLTEMGENNPIRYRHFRVSMAAVKPSVATEDLAPFESWADRYGSKVVVCGDSESDEGPE